MNDHSHDIDGRLAAMKSDRQRLTFLLEQSHALQRSNPPLGRELAERALTIAETLRDRRGIARSREFVIAYLRPVTPHAITLQGLREVRDLYRALLDGAAVATSARSLPWRVAVARRSSWKRASVMASIAAMQSSSQRPRRSAMPYSLT